MLGGASSPQFCRKAEDRSALLTKTQHNVIVVLMIPPFNSDDYLPSGIHLANWASFSTAFATNAHRARLLAGLAAALVPLQQAGCKRIYVDGSFVTRKILPGDYDAAWDPVGVDLAALKILEPLFFEFANGRAAQKAKYFGEFFPATSSADAAGRVFLEFFQTDKLTGNEKGIVALDL